MSKVTTESIALALAVAIVGVVVLTIVSGTGSLPATGLRDLTLALAGGLLGSKVPTP